MLNVKKLLEPEIAEGLANNLTEEGLKRLEEIVEQQEFFSQKNDYEKVMLLDTKFHTIMYLSLIHILSFWIVRIY